MAAGTRGIRILLLAMAVLGSTVSQSSAQGRQNKNDVKRIAVVDMERLASEVNLNLKSLWDLQKREKLNTTIIQTLARNALLSESDQKVLTDLILAEKSPRGLTAAQKIQKQKLLDKSKSMVEDFNALQSTVIGQLSNPDKGKLNHYYKSQSETAQRLEKAKSDFDQNLQDYAQKNRAKTMKQIRATIAKVAKEKGFDLVMSSELVLFTENDLTDDVLKALNKK
jgi:Skp family chaperone for outer membrane proteins